MRTRAFIYYSNLVQPKAAPHPWRVQLPMQTPRQMQVSHRRVIEVAAPAALGRAMTRTMPRTILRTMPRTTLRTMPRTMETTMTFRKSFPRVMACPAKVVRAGSGSRLVHREDCFVEHSTDHGGIISCTCFLYTLWEILQDTITHHAHRSAGSN